MGRGLRQLPSHKAASSGHSVSRDQPETFNKLVLEFLGALV